MWLNKSVATINTIIKILDIPSLRFIYIYIYNKFGYKLDAFSPKIYFPIMLMHKNILKWTKMNQSDPDGPNWTKWNKVNRIGPN